MKKNLLYILLIFINIMQINSGFLTYINTPPKKRIQIYKPDYYQDKVNDNCIIFFSGGSNSISHRIYDDFLKKLQQQNISIYVPCFQYKHMDYLIRVLTRKYKNVIMMGHSSGCNTLLNHCNKKNIKNIILMDPVKTTILKNCVFFLPFIKSVMFIQAMKSYKPSYKPFGLPFIPSFLRLQRENIQINDDSEVQIVEYEQYGHSDILNPQISNFMHFSRITVGHENRTLQHLYDYHTKVSILLNRFFIDNY